MPGVRILGLRAFLQAKGPEVWRHILGGDEVTKSGLSVGFGVVGVGVAGSEPGWRMQVASGPCRAVVIPTGAKLGEPGGLKQDRTMLRCLPRGGKEPFGWTRRLC